MNGDMETYIEKLLGAEGADRERALWEALEASQANTETAPAENAVQP